MAVPYSEASDVMTILQTTDETLETEIEGCITTVDAMIDNVLSEHDLTVPETVPQNIEDASAHFAAWLFRHRRDPGGAAPFKEEAELFLATYLETQGAGESEVAFRVVSDQ